MSLFIYPATPVDTSGLATEAKQDAIITELQEIEADIEAGNITLSSIDSNVATEATLSAVSSDTSNIESNTSSIDAKITTVDTSDVTVSASALPTGAATEATLSSIDGKDFATETTLSSVDTKLDDQATSANQTTANASLSNIESDIDELNSRLAGNLVPETFDDIQISYVAAGNGAGEIEIVEYRTGGAAGTLVATLTLSYDASNRLTSVARS